MTQLSTHTELTGWSHEFLTCHFGKCVYGLCCIPCAFSSLRTQYDGSNWWFNFLCVPAAVVRNIIREGLFINGGSVDDCCVTLWCPCCVYVQTSLEVELPHRRQQVSVQAEGNGRWAWGLAQCDCGHRCVYAYCLPQCATASVRTSYDGSNWWFNCCCISGPLVQNIIRQGYGISGSCCDDITETLFCPCCAAHRMQREVAARGPKGKLIVGVPAHAGMEPLMGTPVQFNQYS